ncbi:hypothetical protein SDRG_12405 [Saprolegnia diclina VS20]|uniref:BZIP domain-containing protein n=1 Tax=Saprolegnia diclina (strain VS20) TaxID=1156394 RepID=T0PWF8_SAPDV|nr:hypothetical protein SDRG_12405 [Saprolegnia diclina VS20]EQC29859.1 hypothetical protein SDRG_12405 [Saprolegnia diclina VS20]|eukprot:XP_008616698.1 hypothetical protein SDRG_12405 [Saprolegnia diclina VS20]
MPQPTSEALRRAEHQRLRNRLKQKRHRDRFTTERKQLLARINDLRAVVTRLETRKPPKTSLPWKIIAGGLAQASVESRLTLELLRQRAAALDHLARAMSAWVAAASTKHPLPTGSNVLAWNQVTLHAEPTTRKLGLDWFTQHMYHNTDRILAAAAFPSEGTVRDIAVLGSAADDLLHVLGRIQIVYDAPLWATYAALESKIWRKLRGDTYPWVSQFLDEEMTQSIDAKMVYRRSPMDADESNYYVSREFASDDRIVFLTGNFNQDTLQPVNEMWRPRMFWFLLERAGPHQTRLRWVSCTGPKIDRGVPMTWREDMASLDLDVSDLSDDAQFTEFQHILERDWMPLLTSDFAFLANSADATDAPSII